MFNKKKFSQTFVSQTIPLGSGGTATVWSKISWHSTGTSKFQLCYEPLPLCSDGLPLSPVEIPDCPAVEQSLPGEREETAGRNGTKKNTTCRWIRIDEKLGNYDASLSEEKCQQRIMTNETSWRWSNFWKRDAKISWRSSRHVWRVFLWPFWIMIPCNVSAIAFDQSYQLHIAPLVYHCGGRNGSEV